jgi:hypothetical protein
MRSFVRHLGSATLAVILIVFCSCERHKPEELHHGGGHSKSSDQKGDGHGHAAGDHGPDEHKHDDHAGHDHAKPATSATPAQFFPSPSPQ